MHVLKEVAPIKHAKLNNVDEISLSIVQYIDECNIGHEGCEELVALHIAGTSQVTLKDSYVFKASSPFRYKVELIPLINKEDRGMLDCRAFVHEWGF